MNDVTKPINHWWVSMQSFSLERKVVLQQTNKKKTHVFSLTCCPNLELKKNNIVFSD
jgi:hypothetical protein